jgi:hypothetical protein
VTRTVYPRVGDVVRSQGGALCEVYRVPVPGGRSIHERRWTLHPAGYVASCAVGVTWDRGVGRRISHTTTPPVFVSSSPLTRCWTLLIRVRSKPSQHDATRLDLAAQHLADAERRGDDTPENLARARAELDRLSTLEAS